MRQERELRHRPADPLHVPKRGICANRPVEASLYYDAPNQFGADGWSVRQIPYDWGGLFKDYFDPAFERPWVACGELQELGYIRTEQGGLFLILHVYAID